MIKTFSVEDGSIEINNKYIELWGDCDKQTTLSIEKCRQMYATNNPDFKDFELIYLLPQSILYPTDEELAEQYAKGKSSSEVFREAHKQDFLAGRKSFGDKEFHLTREELNRVFSLCRYSGYAFEYIVSKLTSPTFPHTITVEQNDDGGHNWGSLKCKY